MEDDLTSKFFGAVEQGQTDIATMLIEKGVNIEAFRLGKTALMVAADKGHTDTVDMLIEHVADVKYESFLHRH